VGEGHMSCKHSKFCLSPLNLPDLPNAALTLLRVNIYLTQYNVLCGNYYTGDHTLDLLPLFEQIHLVQT